MKKDKIAIVMKEFKKGSLKSSSGQKVTNPKQAIAISLSEARRAKEGGMMGKLFGSKESYNEEFGEAKAVAKRKITPAQFARGEKSEGHKGEEKGARQTAEKIRSGKISPADYAKSETTGEKKMAKGGMSGFPVKRKGAADKKTVAMLASKILDAKMGAAPMAAPMAPPMAPPMMPPGMKHGGSVSKRADGVAVRGRTDPKVVKMAAGGMHKMPDGKMMKDSAMKNMAKGNMPEALAKHAAKPASKAHAGLKAGGFVRSADGIAQRGRTKGRLLNKGGRII